VDDNDNVRATFPEGLEYHGFEVIPAASLNEALYPISTDNFDVLLSDLHMPDARDGLTVVSAMRHAPPESCDTRAARLPCYAVSGQRSFDMKDYRFFIPHGNVAVQS